MQNTKNRVSMRLRVALLSSLWILGGMTVTGSPSGRVEAIRPANRAELIQPNPFDLHNSSLARAALSQDESISITSSPESGATVSTGSYITYTITAVNGPAQTPPDLFSRFNLNVPAETKFSSVAFGGFPYVVFINPPNPDTPGPLNFSATTGILLGGFLPSTTIQFTLVVQVTATSGTITNYASYHDLDTTTITSNSVTHTVQAP